ncbi:hypothetical protein BH20CHL7_BH20CHL7_06510 [soil metagenome]
MFRAAFRRILVIGATCALMLVLGVGSALAGEVTGSGKSLKNEDGTLNGKSACAFSGLNDTYSGDPSVPDEDGFFRTQNWGQVGQEGRAFLTSIHVSPRDLCNPTRGGAGGH